MLKDDTGEDEVPHGADGIVIAPLAAALFEKGDEWCVRKVVADEEETRQVIGGVEMIPMEKRVKFEYSHPEFLSLLLFARSTTYEWELYSKSTNSFCYFIIVFIAKQA